MTVTLNVTVIFHWTKRFWFSPYLGAGNLQQSSYNLSNPQTVVKLTASWWRDPAANRNMSGNCCAAILPANRPSRLERDSGGYNGTDETSTSHYRYASSCIYLQTNAHFENVLCWLLCITIAHISHETWNSERFKLTDNEVKMVRHQAICDNFYWR